MNERLFSKRLFVLSILLVVITSCTRPTPEPTLDLAAIVARTQTAIALDQILTATAAPPLPTPTKVILPPTVSITTTQPSVASACTNKAAYIDETIPDGTQFSPGAKFEKTWLLQNAGTCTWTSEYALVFDSGDQMGGVTILWLEDNIPPGEQTEISVPLTAPSEEGQYQSFWKIQSDKGDRFGLGDHADVAFWVKIDVSAGDSVLNLGAPTWEETFDSSASWYLGTDENTNFEVEDGNLVMTALKSAGDQWRISQVGFLSDFYLEAEFSTGDKCASKDSYGFLVRAPDQPDSIIDSGYVVVVSCDGHMRAYLMNNGQYSSLVNWTPNEAIHSGPNKTNRLGVYAQGDEFRIYINNNLISEITDVTYSTGYFGLSIRSDTTQNFQVFVHKIAYWLLE
jgi:hypothetical protein